MSGFKTIKVLGEWVTLTTPENPMEAEIIKGKLESEGIPVFLKKEAIIKATGEGHIKSLQAGRMGLSTSEVGDLIAGFVKE